jgi:hypothetical protein
MFPKILPMNFLPGDAACINLRLSCSNNYNSITFG